MWKHISGVVDLIPFFNFTCCVVQLRLQNVLQTLSDGHSTSPKKPVGFKSFGVVEFWVKKKNKNKRSEKFKTARPSKGV